MLKFVSGAKAPIVAIYAKLIDHTGHQIRSRRQQCLRELFILARYATIILYDTKTNSLSKIFGAKKITARDY